MLRNIRVSVLDAYYISHYEYSLMKKSPMEKTTLIFRLTEAEKQRLYDAAQAEDRTLTALIRRALAPIIMPGSEVHDPPQRKKPEPLNTLTD